MTYSSSVVISRQRYSGRNRNTTSLKDASQTFGPVSNTVVLVVLACLLGLMYLTQVTKTVSYGYQINSLKQEQSTLSAEYNQLEVASARLKALERVKNSDSAKSLVAASPSQTVRN